MHDKKNLILSIIKFTLLFLFTGLVFCIKPVYSSFELKSENSVEVEIISVEELKELIKNRNGKLLLMNVWATWCAPCREEFPDLVKLANEYGEEIDIIGISVDFPEEIDTKIIPFLKKQNAVFTNYVIKVVEPENFINLLNEDWSGAIPATFVYDEKGNQVEYLIGKQTYEEFEKVVKKL
jgi:thiol-disulfide isomerase/thioredoxin